MNFFIVKNDQIGTRFQQALIERARAGVKVYFLFDEIGSHKLPRRYLKELKAAGVECHSFDINRFWWKSEGEGEFGGDLQFLRYGFQFRKNDFHEEVISGELDRVIDRMVSEAKSADSSRRAVIESVDDGWEVSLLKLAFDTARRSAGGNVDEWKKRGLI